MTQTQISVPIRYVPTQLSKSDKKKQINALCRSRKLYSKYRYYTRPTISSYSHKPSKHILRAKTMYKLAKIIPNNALAAATGCNVNALQAIVKKGEGAYYSSGSRPNQTPQSWGYARLASSVTGGKASIVDFHILQNGCKSNSIALQLAKRKMQKGLRKTRKVNFLL